MFIYTYVSLFAHVHALVYVRNSDPLGRTRPGHTGAVGLDHLHDALVHNTTSTGAHRQDEAREGAGRTHLDIDNHG